MSIVDGWVADRSMRCGSGAMGRALGMGGLTEIKSLCGAVADEALRIPESWLIEMLR